ncbi:centrosomal protein of 70 kDa [Bombina bombina]|uniref:centrosomal protein of 70 kDa n=1 Tax=Bombina bombina TaxID=8345 RepID=UPI00235AF280|nr:centrosomal protein of 70 kDa [Bombina bombina]
MSKLAMDVKEDKLRDELSEWENTNKILKRHGCNPVSVSNNKDLEGAIVLDPQASLSVRTAIRSLVEDTERRQNLIHGLIQTNNQLKEDVRQQQGRAARHEQKANDLQRILDSVKSKIRDLEDDFISKTCQQQNQMKNLLKEKQTAYEQSQKHKDMLVEKEEHITLLKKQLSEALFREENRAASHKKVFMRLMRRPPRENGKLDQEIMDIIDGYERQISRLQKDKYKDFEIPERESSEESLDLDATPNYKALLKSYQEQMRQTREKHELLVRENLKLRDDLESRPTTKELQYCKQRVRKLEKILDQNNISFRGVKKDDTLSDPPSTQVRDVEQLPASDCRRFLQNVCKELNVEDLRDLIPVVSAKVRKEETCNKLYKILYDISSVLSSHRAPQLLYKPSNRLQESRGTERSDEADFLHLLPTVEMWAGQLLSLKALHRALRKLSEKLLPYQKTDEPQEMDSIHIEDLLLLVDTMMEDVVSKEKDSLNSSPHTLQALISHFQKLFDVPSVSGVYPRMNELYSKLGEMNNAMKNLRCMLGIDAQASSGALVTAVWQLCKEVEEGESKKIEQVLGTLDIDSIITKIQEYDEFFPAFEELIKTLLEILEISRLDDILPAVCKLKGLASR